MRRRLLRTIPVVLAVLMALQIASCRVYDAFVLPHEAEGLVRDAVEAPSGWTVSYIQAPQRASGLRRLIYVHGTPGDATAFEEYLLNPVPGFNSLAIDRPGFGHTRPKRPALTLREQAQSLEPFLQSVDGKKPILVGHSLGAPVVLRAALDYPGRVGGLVLISPSVDPALETIAWYQRLATYFPVAWMIPRFLRNSNRELFPLKHELQTLASELGRLQCPVSILHAPNDILVPFSNVGYLRDRLPPDLLAGVVVLEGKNHFIPWNAEDAVKEAIRTVAEATRQDGASAATGAE